MSNPRAAIRINLVMGGLSEQGADALLDAYAHQLAEKIRAWVAEPMSDSGAPEYGSSENVLEAADRIDPEAQR